MKLPDIKIKIGNNEQYDESQKQLAAKMKKIQEENRK